jgi:hypothetical protein
MRAKRGRGNLAAWGRYGGRGGRVGGLGIYRKGWGWWGNEGKMELEWEMHKFTR